MPKRLVADVVLQQHAVAVVDGEAAVVTTHSSTPHTSMRGRSQPRSRTPRPTDDLAQPYRWLLWWKELIRTDAAGRLPAWWKWNAADRTDTHERDVKP